MANKRDVELVIRARNEASKAINTIAGALKDLTGAQDAVAKSTAKADGVLSQFGQELEALRGRATGLRDLATAVRSMERDAAAVAAAQERLNKATERYDQIKDKTTKTAKRLEATLQAQREKLTELQAASAQSAAEAARLGQSLGGVAARGEAVQAAVAETSEDIKRLSTAFRDLRSAATSSGRAVADGLSPLQRVRAQAAAVAESREAMQRARAAATELGRELARVQTPNEELRKSFLLARSAALQATLTYQKQASALNQMTGRAGGSFREFSQRAEAAAKAAREVAAAATKAATEAAADLAKLSQQLVDLRAARGQIAAATTAPAGGGSRIDALRAIRAQIDDVRKAKEEMEKARAAATALGRQMAQTASPTHEMQRAFIESKIALEQATQAYLRAETTLNRMRGIAQTTFRAFSQSLAPVKEEAAQVTAAMQRTELSLRSVRQAAQQTAEATERAARSTNGLRGAFRSFYGDSRKALSLVQRIRGEILGLTTAYLGLYQAIHQIGGVVTAFRELESAQNRLGAIFNQDLGAVSTEMDFLTRTASRLGIQFGVLANEYSKFAVAANTANFSLAATREVFTSVAAASRVNKLSIDEMRGVFLALQQMISKGKVSSEELRRQLGDRLPGAFQIMAEALGMTTAELDKAMHAGEVYATQSTLLKFARQLDKTFGGQLAKSLTTVTAQIGRFENAIFQAQLRVAHGGFIEALSRGLTELNDFFESRDGRDFFLGVGKALGGLTSGVIEAAKHFDTLLFVLKAFVALKVAQSLSNIGARFAAMATQAAAMAAGMSKAEAAAAVAGGRVTFLGQSTAAASRVMAGFRTAVTMTTGSISASGVAALGLTRRALVLSRTMQVLRASMLAVGAIARGLFALVGGIPGIIAGAIVFGLTEWIGGVDDATKALDEHQRIMQEVLKAYDAVGGKANDWAKAVENVTAVQAKENLDAMKKMFDRAAKDFLNVAVPGTFTRLRLDVAAMTSGPNSELAKQLRDLQDQFRKTGAGAGEVARQINKIATQIRGDKFLQDLATEMGLAAEKAAQAERNLGAAASTAQGFGLDIGDLTRFIRSSHTSIKELAEGVSETNSLFRFGSFDVDAYNDALERVAKAAPKLSKQLKLNKDLADAFKSGIEALNTALRAGEFGKALTALSTTGRAVFELVSEHEQALIDELAGNTKVTARLVGFLMKEEGFRSEAYRDDGGTATIGFGHTASAGGIDPNVTTSITREQAFKQLVRDIELFAQQVDKLVKVPITDAMREALISYQFNTGKLAGSAILKAVNEGDFAKAMEELKNGIATVNGVVNPALKARREREAQLFGSQGLNPPEFVAQRMADQQEYNEEFAKTIEQQKFELEQLKESGRQAAINAAIREQELKAKEAGVVLTEEEKQKIAEVTGALYDRQNADEEVNRLLEKRNLLQQQLDDAVKIGAPTEHVEELREKIKGVNDELQTAIQRAIAFYREMGGPNAENAILKMQAVAAEVQATGERAAVTKVEIRDLLVDGLTNAVDRFAQAVAKGENVFEAMRDAFLQFAADFLREIAQMILKQIIFNSISSFLGLGGGVPVFHSGGVVGAAGGRTRQVSPAIFAHAMRYHTGGIVGLRPNEVPAILEKGERVLTAEDQRALGRGGSGNGGGGQAPALRQVLVFDPSDIASAMQSKPGEQVFLTWVRKNAPTLKTILGA